MVALTKTTKRMLARAASRDPLAAAQAFIVARMGSEPWRKLDEIEAVMEKLPQQQMPLHHVFTPGLYHRTVFMFAGALVTSRIHLTEHPFVISSGRVSVWDDENGWVTLEAPYVGVTKAGTRRMLYCHTAVTWSTTHLNPDGITDPDEMMCRLTYCGGKYKSLGGSKA